VELCLTIIFGISNAKAIIYLIDRYGDKLSIYAIGFDYIDDVDRNPVSNGFDVIVHLTHDVDDGRMKYWADFYDCASKSIL
jgi:4-hydroxyphenylpyruvate dioxygenase